MSNVRQDVIYHTDAAKRKQKLTGRDPDLL